MTEEFRFFTDIHIPLDAVNELRRRGIDILRSIEAGFPENADDKVLLAYATSERRIMVTCDRGFENHRVEWLESGQPHTSILYFNMAKGDCSDVGIIVAGVLFVYEAADSKDLYTQF